MSDRVEKKFKSLSPRYKLTLIHKMIIILLAAIGLLSFTHYDIYQMKVEYNPEEVWIPFLKAGDYEIDIMYQGASEGNNAVVSAEYLTDSNNRLGAVLAREALDPGDLEGRMILDIHLDQGTYGIRIWPEHAEPCFEEVKVQRVQLLDRDNYFICALCFLGAAVTALLGWFVPLEKYRDAAILTGIGLAASLPLFSDFLLEGDDLKFHLARLEGLYQGLRAGEFPVRINPVQTELFGNLTATMYPQLFLYPAALLRFLDISVMLSYKLLVISLNIGAAVFTFYAVKRMIGSVRAAYIASLLYTFSLYRLVDVYYRAALGEALAMTFLPLLVWGIYEVLWGDKKRWHILAIGMTCVIQSHILSVAMALVFLVLETIVWLMSYKGKGELSRILAGVKAAVATFLLNLGTIVPLLFFSGENFVGFSMDCYVPDFGVYFSQMFSLFPSAVGESLEMGTTKGEMPLTVGGVLMVGVLLFCVAAHREKKRSKTTRAGLHCLGFGLVSLGLSSWIFPWERLSQNDFWREVITPLQYSWRFLGPASLFLCIVSAIGLCLFASQSEGKNWVLGIFLTVALGSACFLIDSMTLQMDVINDEMFLEGNTEYDSLYMYDDGEEAPDFAMKMGVAENYIKAMGGTQVEYTEYHKEGTTISVHTVPLEKPQGEEYLMFPLYYYPGYEILVNGERVEAISQHRLLACRLPEEASYIQVSYKGYGSWRVADAVSWLMAAAMIGYMIWLHRKEKGAKQNPVKATSF